LVLEETPLQRRRGLNWAWRSCNPRKIWTTLLADVLFQSHVGESHADRAEADGEDLRNAEPAPVSRNLAAW
jgi:hypothetical protein